MAIKQLQAWAHPRRVLLATDLTDLEHMLQVAIEQAKAYEAELLIVHVLPDPGHFLIDPTQMVYCEPALMQEKAHASLDQAVARVTAEGVRCSSRLLYGDVVDEIAKTVTEWKAGRLVAGSHGTRKFLLQILGSVAASLFHHVEVPILAVGPNALPARDPVRDRMRIVLGMSLDSNAERLAEFALNVAVKHSAAISLIHIMPEIAKAHPSAAQVATCSQKMLDRLLTGRKLGRCEAVCEVVQGQPVDAILAYAGEHSADLIILGASAHSAFNEHFIPGTAYRVLCESPCPVLVLKHDAA